MIRYPRGWATRTFRLTGAMAQSLHRTLTQNGFSARGACETHRMTCLHRRTYHWVADFNHPLSFIAKERWAFLQIALAHLIQFLFEAAARLATPSPGQLELVLPDPLGLPAIGVRNQHVLLLLTLRYSRTQGITSFLETLDRADAHFKAKGFWPRWVMPHSGHFPKDHKFSWEPLSRSGLALETPDGAFWPILDATFAEDLDAGSNRFHLNLESLAWDDEA